MTLGTSLWTIRLIMFLRGIAMAFAFVPMQAATYANITPVDTGRASAIYSTQRQVAAALGVATLGTVLISNTSGPTAQGALNGYHVAFLTGTVLVAVAAVSGLLIRDEDAAATMRSRAPREEPVLEAV
jgi:MFS family permease